MADNDCNCTGGNAAICSNDGFDLIFINDFNFIDSIGQFNSVTLSGDVSSEQLNDAAISQGGALVNTCDETGGGVNQVTCQNLDDANILGPVFQFNTVDAPNSDTASQSNGAQVTQNLEAVNDCDEEDTGFNFAICENELSINQINPITQTNNAIVGGDTVQSNFVGMNQDMQLENVCDETGLGDNAALCNNNLATNFIGQVSQLNDADGSGDADFTQNNNMPTISQALFAENDCDQSDEQSAEGDNLAVCSNDNAINNIAFISQINDAQGTHVDDIFQDNTAALSQVLTLNNGCDATTFTISGDNFAICTNGQQMPSDRYSKKT